MRNRSHLLIEVFESRLVVYKAQAISSGFVDSKCDPSQFLYFSDNVRVFLFVYMDDIVVTGSYESTVRSIISKLGGEFAI